MRTTLTLDDEIAKELRRRARHSGESWKVVVNATLRRGLESGEKPSPPLSRFKVQPKACGFRTGVDILRLNQLNDDLEMEEFERRMPAARGEP
ncbi:MAG: hypothetical protein M3O15_06745 [Acidobacteriota bacterium]|nr:hypothetical protein [Acidobacteriota bacterium]